MKLDTHQRILSVADAHDLFDCSVCIQRPGSHFKAVWQGFPVNGKRVIAHCLVGVFKAFEQSFGVVMNSGGLAVHDVPCPYDPGAERLADGLVPETDADDRQLSGKVTNQFQRYSGLFRSTGAGREHNTFWLSAFYFRHRNLVVSLYPYLGSELTQVLNEVVGEGIVVIQDQDHWLFQSWLLAEIAAWISTCTLLMVSFHSFCGWESNTSPAPAWA